MNQYVIDHGKRNRLVMQTKTFKERSYIDIRKQFEDANGVWRPTRKGIMFPLGDLPVLLEGLTALLPLDGLQEGEGGAKHG